MSLHDSGHGHELFESLFEFAPEAILVLDRSGTITRVNERALGMFGYTRHELEGLGVDDLVPAELRARHADLRESYSKAPNERRMGVGFDVWAERKDGSRVPVEIALLPLQIGAQSLVLAMVHDISDRHLSHLALQEAQNQLEQRVAERTQELWEANQRLREQVRERQHAEQCLREEQAKLIQAEKLSSIGLLAAGIAHEINNPLSGVMGCVKALKSGELDPSRRAEYLATIEDGLSRMRGTVRGLLDYARQRPPEAAAVDVVEVIEATLRLIEPVARKKRLELVCREASGPVLVWADQSQLMQALLNVLMNAVQATPAGGEVAIEVCRGEPQRVGLRVSDSGMGFDPQHLGRACDPFFTTKPAGEGTGLGLAVTLGIVESHGGEFQLENAENGGARVTLWLRTPSDESGG